LSFNCSSRSVVVAVSCFRLSPMMFLAANFILMMYFRSRSVPGTHMRSTCDLILYLERI
ncbi:Hypothetical predicted protein, partial [Pelobates cultripes]